MKITFAEKGFAKTNWQLIKRFPLYYFSMLLLPPLFSELILELRLKFVYRYTPPVTRLEGGFFSAYQYIWTDPNAYTQIFPPFILAFSLLIAVFLLWLIYHKKDCCRSMIITAVWCNISMLFGCTFLFLLGWALFFTCKITAVSDFYENFGKLSMSACANYLGMLAYFIVFYYRSKSMLYHKIQ